MVKTRLYNSLKKDVLNTVHSIYRMNAGHCIGYLFNPTNDNKSIATGMYCNFKDEINADNWTYFYDFENFYLIEQD